jgi:hypothetical protein
VSTIPPYAGRGGDADLLDRQRQYRHVCEQRRSRWR